MNESQVVEVWTLFKEYIDKKAIEIAAERYVDLLADYGVADDILTSALGTDNTLDDAINYFLDVEDENYVRRSLGWRRGLIVFDFYCIYKQDNDTCKSLLSECIESAKEFNYNVIPYLGVYGNDIDPLVDKENITVCKDLLHKVQSKGVMGCFTFFGKNV